MAHGGEVKPTVLVVIAVSLVRFVTRVIREDGAVERQRGEAVRDNLLPGPRAALPFFEAPRNAGMTLHHRHGDWKTSLGMYEIGAACCEYGLLSEALRLEVTLDQHPTLLVSPEFCRRRFLQIETAVQRSARHSETDTSSSCSRRRSRPPGQCRRRRSQSGSPDDRGTRRGS